nr:histidinol-phosphate transaminase [uncultured Butyrivibrio sp.]
MLHGGEIYDKEIKYDYSVNLNPLPCPESVISAMNDAIKLAHQYPDINQTFFRQEVARAEGNGIKASNVIGGNGASELMAAVVRLVNPRKVLLAVPCFLGYRHALNMLDNCIIQTYLLSEEKGFALNEAFIDEISEDIDLVILANPNNPTGRRIEDTLLTRIAFRCKETGSALMVDECFLSLSSGGESMNRLIGQLPGLFVIKAYTKLFSLPGIRIGYCIADEKDIDALHRFLPEWNMSVVAQMAGVACAKEVTDRHFVKTSVKEIERMRKELTEGLSNKGILFFPSDTNFILLKSQEPLYDKCLRSAVLIRDCSNFEGLGMGYYRIAVKDSKPIMSVFSVKDRI